MIIAASLFWRIPKARSEYLGVCRKLFCKNSPCQDGGNQRQLQIGISAKGDDCLDIALIKNFLIEPRLIIGRHLLRNFNTGIEVDFLDVVEFFDGNLTCAGIGAEFDLFIPRFKQSPALFKRKAEVENFLEGWPVGAPRAEIVQVPVEAGTEKIKLGVLAEEVKKPTCIFVRVCSQDRCSCASITGFACIWAMSFSSVIV